MSLFHHTHTDRQRGFTLIEILITLAVLSIALTAILKTSTDNISTFSRIENANIAHWLAMNLVAEAQLDLIKIPNSPAHLNGKTELLNREFYWTAHLYPLRDIAIDRLMIRVYREKDGPLITQLESFLPEPVDE